MYRPNGVSPDGMAEEVFSPILSVFMSFPGESDAKRRMEMAEKRYFFVRFTSFFPRCFMP